MKKIKKILIIGDSNCMPKYSKSKKESLVVENIYTYLLKKKYKKHLFSEVVWGGVKTSMLINYSISYYKKWKPDFIIVHSGVNDVKTQLFSEKTNQKIFKISKILNLNNKKIKKNIFYNPKYLKYSGTNKASSFELLQQAKKIKKNFINSKIIWIGIHSNQNINKERPNTFKSVEIFNQKLKKFFKNNFIDNNFKDIYFRKDGYHLNHLGHKILFKKLSKLINLN